MGRSARSSALRQDTVIAWTVRQAVAIAWTEDGSAMSEIQDILRTDLVDAVDIAQVLDATPRSVTRWQQGEVRPRRDTVDRLLELKAVLDLAQQVMRPESVRLWLRSPIPALDYERPLDLVRSGEFRRVIASLAALAEGVTP
jgi:putative toxin-antitoxin system antitoxin component (TIGR02293 family)